MRKISTLITIAALLLATAATAAQAEERAVLHTVFGDIEISFFPQQAPRHVKNFKKLVSEGFYDGTYFHRVIPGFMIQGGDPNTKDDDRGNDGHGNAGYTLPAEFSSIKHERGILSMARKAEPDTASSQFFIMVDKAPHLDSQYSVFGKVEKGMDVVDTIAALPRDSRDNPEKPALVLRAYLKEVKE